MFDRILGWIDGFTTASRFAYQSINEGWLTPEVLLGMGSVAATALSAIAAVAASRATRAANKSNSYQVISTRRLEILRITSENIAELLMARDKFKSELEIIKVDLQNSHPSPRVIIGEEIDALISDTTTQLDTMIAANEHVTSLVFEKDDGSVREWDDYIRSTLKKRQEINHSKSALELKTAQMARRVSALQPGLP